MKKVTSIKKVTLKFYTSEAKVLKLKVKKLLGVILMFVEVTGKKMVGEAFPLPYPE